MVTSLTPMEQRLFDVLDGQGDVEIEKIFAYVRRGHSHQAERRTRVYLSVREKQMALGELQRRLNEKLSGQRVQPGQLKQTLCLVDL